MATYGKMGFSVSTNGKGVLVASTTSPGTVIHTSINNIVDMDEIWLYAQNNHTADVPLTLLWGGTANPNDFIQQTIPFKKGLYLIVPGMILNNANPVRAFAGTANVITIFGWVNRIFG